MEKNINYIKDALLGIYPETEIDAFISWIFAYVKQYSRMDIILNKAKVLGRTDSEAVKAIVERLKQHEPIQYIIGETEFCGLKLKVGKGVLVPRPETEEIVEHIRYLIDDSDRILDIGTGSACIALALKNYKPLAEVSACDVSEEALAIARSNAEYNQLLIDFFRCNILESDEVLDPFDVIVSNPPYVRKSEMRLMQSNVLNYEPHLALFVDDDDPLLFYRAIVSFSQNNLKSGGSLFFEINEALADDVVTLMGQNGFEKVFIRQDLQGKDRLVGGEKIHGIRKHDN